MCLGQIQQHHQHSSGYTGENVYCCWSLLVSSTRGFCILQRDLSFFFLWTNWPDYWNEIYFWDILSTKLFRLLPMSMCSVVNQLIVIFFFASRIRMNLSNCYTAPWCCMFMLVTDGNLCPCSAACWHGPPTTLTLLCHLVRCLKCT